MLFRSPIILRQGDNQLHRLAEVAAPPIACHELPAGVGGETEKRNIGIRKCAMTVVIRSQTAAQASADQPEQGAVAGGFDNDMGIKTDIFHELICPSAEGGA